MTRFGYLQDPLSLAAVAAYGINRWLLKPRTDSPFLQGHFNDLLLIPAALPLVLWIHRKTGLRSGDRPPTWREILFHLVVWTLLCEVVAPAWLRLGTADPVDAAAYAAGAVAAGFWWNRREAVTAALP